MDHAGTSRTPELKGTYRSTILALLVLVYTFNFIDRMIVATLGQAIKVDLQITDAQLGLLQGLAFAIFFTTLGIPLGRLAEHVSRVNIITVCLALWSGMTALCGAAGNYTHLFLCRMGVGIGEAGCSPPAHSLITDMYAERTRATALSIYSLGIPLGTMVGAMAGGWIADELGWRQAFLIVGLPGIVLALVFKIVVKEPQRGLADGVRPNLAAAPPPLGEVVRQLFGNRSFVHILVGATLIGFVAYGTGTFTQPYFHRAFGLSYTQVGLIFGLIGGAAAAAGTVLGGIASDWAGRRASAGTCSYPDSAFCWLPPDTSWPTHGSLRRWPWRALSSRCCSITCTSADARGYAQSRRPADARDGNRDPHIYLERHWPWSRPVRHR